ncbi:uncharacterized protein LOC129590633 [Paramacrobiotus metropolitanus]|uniref:uncharacterized protein LOC129590633 n=1 Tax=Paramacrobiotus metropolitanus TaxID=2943436 RepID=UPI0024457350|nr:uncharacterized protein LOC129590633 [Paramacrobiotus metropolitanus]
MDYFSHGKRNTDNRQANLGNTVLINRGDDVWMLAYIQDIDGDNIFVDFDCAELAPCWIHSQYVWQHHFCEPQIDNISLVHVAVRKTYNGPYILRPGLLFDRVALLYVVRNKDTGEPAPQHVVHRRQIVEELPTEQPSLWGRLHEIPIIKLTFRSEHNRFIRKISEYEMLRFVQLVFSSAGYSLYGWESHRFFVKLVDDRMVWLFLGINQWRMYKDGLSGHCPFSADCERRLVTAAENLVRYYSYTERELEARWNVYMLAVAQNGFGFPSPQTLAELTGTWFAPCSCRNLSTEYTKASYCCRPTCEQAALHQTVDQFTISDKITYMPGKVGITILPEVLLQLDCRSRALVRRVCYVWKTTIDASNSTLVIVDFQTIRHHPAGLPETEEYYYSGLIDHSVKHSTRTLALLNLGRRGDDVHDELDGMAALFRLKKIELPTIIIKNSVAPSELFCGRFSMERNLFHLPILAPYCRQLLVCNYSILDIFCSCPRDFLEPFEPWHSEDISVTLSFMRFHDTNGLHDEDILRYFMALVEENLPSVETIIEKIRQNWIAMADVVAYPEGWQHFRQFLQKHAFDGNVLRDNYWATADLRDFETLRLSRFQTHLLNACKELPFHPTA